ncbi:2,4-dienoyl-CoA reductase-like NADH-dependent reductase (Old Yellow Enzyme family) [Friedmanniella endophytica]|uniref:2,4-dienoyl-CoA reductase-like NADH-dependent reductase (Old Yellow Enzyme family) n=1 Tax=Microlunatus kandeliicorticis TaxID=1759536 RepID=A0A7W3P7S2_9ACTN|nr:NADH:flavin oxidoreductase/NADH oxidase [Microlunatus kandeliicorticis]MBA8796319.1 2,4-dienoyl-CoA reductase-like NADH-dependent reductase (Old Yellow Enzyme family) [Microlunatus kandeliicorticis]
MSTLFEPIRLRDLTVRNRVWLAPMCQYSVERRDGVPTDWHLVHLGARAQGGFGLIITEATAVTPEGRISPEDTGLWNETQERAWARIVDFAHRQGAAVGVQLAHAGRKGSTYRGFPGEPRGSVGPDDGGWPTVSASDQAYPGLAAPTALTADGIAELVRAFADAAVRADRAGFDVVELHAAHGYLVHEFLSPLSNHRDDAWGGDFTGRTRFLREVVTAVRAVWPAGKPLLVRLSATDWVDGGWDADQTVRLSRELAALGVDLVDTSSGGNAPAEIPVEPGYQVPFARRVRQEAGLPSGAVGLLVEPQQAEKVLAEGDADVVLLARAALREPSWPQRAAAELGVDPEEVPYPAAYLRGRWEDAPQV